MVELCPVHWRTRHLPLALTRAGRGAGIDLKLPSMVVGAMVPVALVVLEKQRDALWSPRSLGEPGRSARHCLPTLALCLSKHSGASRGSVSGLPVEAIAAAARNGGTDILGALPSRAAEPWNGAMWPTRLTAEGVCHVLRGVPPDVRASSGWVE
jgi:hypothetical protein